ncbi:MAG: sigma-54-dependent Fis family transcriptional regulator [Candidatus Anammoximicrobium sp.]|nr:sigma-54-dependent Fis family transcriptional regulator [Candidatus Anammoximicrobium sp.]
MTQHGFRILIVDDEPNIRAGLAKGLAGEADDLATAQDAEEAWTLFQQQHQQVVITDLKMSGRLSGLELLRQIKESRPETVVLVITAHGTIETAVEAMRLGAHDFVAKPVDLNMLRLQVRKAFAHYRLVEENRRLRARLDAMGEFPDMVGHSAAMQHVFDRIRQVANADVTVLVQGESGTGKELVARAIHNLSARKGRPFIAANVGALPETLVESELFGYEKGAYSGATRQKPGWFEMADGGTLFLDEIGEMPPKTQVDLLRLLEQRELRRLGGEVSIPIDVRLIAATNRDLDELAAENRFRQDLYYRINVVPLRIPPLRQRRDDIPPLVEHCLQQAEQRYGGPSRRVAPAAMRVLCDHPWPGNVRQLRNLMERLVVTVESPTIHAEDLPQEFRTVPRSEVITLEEAVEEAEKQAILAALANCHQHRERTAQLLGISVRTLHYKMNRYSLQ